MFETFKNLRVRYKLHCPENKKEKKQRRIDYEYKFYNTRTAIYFELLEIGARISMIQTYDTIKVLK